MFQKVINSWIWIDEKPRSLERKMFDDLDKHKLFYLKSAIIHYLTIHAALYEAPPNQFISSVCYWTYKRWKFGP
jgi:hypothetical protein